MKAVLMGLAGLGMSGLGMLAFGAASANASPLATGTNLATPETGATSIVEQVRRINRHQYRPGPYKGGGWRRGR